MKVKLKKLAIGAIVIIFLFSNAIKPAYLKLTAPDHIKNFSREQALEDYDYMWRYLEDNYPYFGVAQRKYGADKDAIKEKYRKKIQESGSFGFNSFYKTINDCVYEFRGAGHLAVFNPSFFNMVTEQVSYFDTQGKDMNFAFSAVRDPNSISTYDYLEKLRSGMSLNIKSMSRKNVTTKILNEDTAYLKVVNFFEDHLKADQEKIFEFYRSIADKENLIIDVRNYQGGSDQYWIQNIISPNILEPIGYDSVTLLMGGEENEALISNGKLKNLNTDFTQIKELPNINKDDLQLMNYWFNSTYEIKPSVDKKLFEGNIYVIIDNSVGSSTEAFVQLCKQTGFATLVGTNSRGDGAAGLNPVAKSLPNSGIVFWSRVVYGLNPDGSSNAEYGTTPDYPAQVGEDLLDACLRVIRDS